jgi:hypothetical protein
LRHWREGRRFSFGRLLGKMTDMPSQKTVVVDHLWDVLSAENRTIATFQDVREAINFCNEKYGNSLKTDNPANFMKDLLRGGNASTNWPARLKERRITGRQITGEDRIFEFVPYVEGQVEPFPNPFEKPTLPTCQRRALSSSRIFRRASN